MTMRHTINVLVENEFGVLTRVAALFSGRAYNIQSLSVAETLDPKLSRITLVTMGDDAHIEQIVKQLNKLVNVIKVQDMTKSQPLERILALVKISLSQKNRMEVIKTIELLEGKVLDADNRCCTVEFTGEEEKIKSAINMLRAYGIIEFIQTGAIAIGRGK